MPALQRIVNLGLVHVLQGEQLRAEVHHSDVSLLGRLGYLKLFQRHRGGDPAFPIRRGDGLRKRVHGRGNLSLSRSLRGGVGVVLVGGRIRDAVAVLARVKETSSRVVNGGDIV